MSIGTVIAYGILILLIIVLMLVLIFRQRLYTPNPDDFGTWISNTGPCINYGLPCANSGTQLVVNRCLPNTRTGYGCLRNNQQTFKPYLERKVCYPSCVASVFTLDEAGPCLSYSVDQLQLVKNYQRYTGQITTPSYPSPQGSGESFQELTYRCTPTGDPNGVLNYCQLQDIISGKQITLLEGDFYTVFSQC